jgi:hypothetical protein
MVEILGLPDDKAEEVLFNRMRHLDRVEKLSYAERGMICRQVQNYMLHEKRDDPETGQPCTFTRWVRLSSPWGYSTVFSAMRDVEALKGIPDEDVAEIPQSNFPIMIQLSTDVQQDPKVLEAAKTQRTEEFVEHIREHHPEQNIEHRKFLRFQPEESAAKKIEEALDKAIERGAHNRNEALEMVCAEAMMQWQYESEVQAVVEGMIDEPTQADS